MLKNKAVDIIGVPFNKGVGIAGADLGPDALRNMGLLHALRQAGIAANDTGNVTCPPCSDSKNQNGLKNLEAVNGIINKLYKKVAETVKSGRFPLILGGDHSIAPAGAMAVNESSPCGIIWVDSHGDFNTAASSPSGNVHGIPLSVITGRGAEGITLYEKNPKTFIAPEKAVIIGARALDSEEAVLLQKSGVTVFSAADIKRLGIKAVAEKAASIAGSGTSGVYLSFDLDFLDPSEAPGVSVPEQNGVSAAEALQLCGELSNLNLLALELVELNPLRDKNNRTAELAVSIICALLK